MHRPPYSLNRVSKDAPHSISLPPHRFTPKLLPYVAGVLHRLKFLPPPCTNVNAVVGPVIERVEKPLHANTTRNAPYVERHFYREKKYLNTCTGVLMPNGDFNYQHMLLRICLLVSHFPWGFGPYQQQMYLLSHELVNKGYDILWMPFVVQLEEQLYDSSHFDAPIDYNHTFITYAGIQNSYVRTSTMNRLAEKYSIDAYITLLDVERFIRDTDLKIPSIAWHPHHFSSWTPLDAYILKGFASVASLQPGEEHFIPHIVQPVPVTQKWHRDKDTFFILLQGGNYETFDRKGWEISLQAYAEFHKRVPESHLYIHSVSKIAMMEKNANKKAPISVPDEGQPLRYLLHMLNITDYTLDESIHPPERISALKEAADVCLHPSRVEGFGMNVLECQYFGTPVITTNFTAMGAFTRFGHSVPPVQLSYYLRGFVAVPNISGVVEALHKIHQNVWIGSSTRVKEWILNDFSAYTVGNAFHRLLQNLHIKYFDTGIRRVYGEYMDIISADENRQWTMFGHLDTIPSVSDKSDVVRFMQNGMVAAIMVKTCLLLHIQIQTVWVPKMLYTIINAPHVNTIDISV